MIVFICIGIQAYVNSYFPRKFIANCHSSKTMSLYGMQRISGNISYTLLEQSYMSEAFDWNAFHMYFISSVVEYLRNMCLSVMNISANISSVMIILNSLIWFIVKIWQNTFSMEFLFMEYCCFRIYFIFSVKSDVVLSKHSWKFWRWNFLKKLKKSYHIVCRHRILKR